MKQIYNHSLIVTKNNSKYLLYEDEGWQWKKY